MRRSVPWIFSSRSSLGSARSNGATIELTRKLGHVAGSAPSEDNLLVFYLPDAAEWQEAVNRMLAAGYEPVRSFNPYWDCAGRTFQDPDGYRVVLQNAPWTV